MTRATQYLQNVGAVLEGVRNVDWRLTALQNAAYYERVLVLYEGKLVFDGLLDKLKQKLHQYELVLDNSSSFDESFIENLKAGISESNIRFSIKVRRLIVRFNDVHTGLALASEIELRGIKIVDLEIKRISMEKAYLEVVKEGEKMSRFLKLSINEIKLSFYEMKQYWLESIAGIFVMT
ncbi:MAG: hypothetical protein JKY88_00825, partial [Pseudomonadales bacterium]|nr:hypothetical protein [Pseudomonadales bacterium]